MKGQPSLFETVVTLTGLATFIGPGVVRRALQSVGVSAVEMATKEDYRRALPGLRARMATYLTDEQLDSRLHEIISLLR
jgi:hypothetical protein